MTSTGIGVFTLELWAQVAGTNTNRTDDGFLEAYLNIQSNEASGDLFDGSLISGTTQYPFAQGRNGSANLLNNDGVGDWGSNSSTLTDSKYMLAKSAVTVFAGDTTGRAVNATAWEFKLATFQVSVDAIHGTGGDETRFVVTKPPPSFPVQTLAKYTEDGVSQTVTSQQFAGVYGSYVSLISESRWDGGAGGSGAEWTTAGNWAGDVLPPAGACAAFGAAGSAGSVGINFSAVAGNTLNAGMIRLNSDCNRSVTLSNSNSTTGVMALAGLGGTVLDNRANGRTLKLMGSGTGTMTISLPGAATINVSSADAWVIINAAVSSHTNITKTGAGTLVMSATQQTWSGALTVGAGKVVMNSGTSGGVIRLDSLSITSGAVLDLTDNDLVVTSGNYSVLNALRFEGYRDSVDSAATGIVSTVGQTLLGHPILALFDNDALQTSEWPFGSGVSVSSHAILGRFAYLGDADLNGMVTPDDYGAVDSNLGAHVGTAEGSGGMNWFAGDWNLDGDITPDDYGAIDANLGLGEGNPLAPAALPEPGGLIAVGASALLLRRRRAQAQ